MPSRKRLKATPTMRPRPGDSRAPIDFTEDSSAPSSPADGISNSPPALPLIDQEMSACGPADPASATSPLPPLPRRGPSPSFDVSDAEQVEEEESGDEDDDEKETLASRAAKRNTPAPASARRDRVPRRQPQPSESEGAFAAKMRQLDPLAGTPRRSSRKRAAGEEEQKEGGHELSAEEEKEGHHPSDIVPGSARNGAEESSHGSALRQFIDVDAKEEKEVREVKKEEAAPALAPTAQRQTAKRRRKVKLTGWKPKKDHSHRDRRLAAATLSPAPAPPQPSPAPARPAKADVETKAPSVVPASTDVPQVADAIEDDEVVVEEVPPQRTTRGARARSRPPPQSTHHPRSLLAPTASHSSPPREETKVGDGEGEVEGEATSDVQSVFDLVPESSVVPLPPALLSPAAQGELTAAAADAAMDVDVVEESPPPPLSSSSSRSGRSSRGSKRKQPSSSTRRKAKAATAVIDVEASIPDSASNGLDAAPLPPFSPSGVGGDGAPPAALVASKRRQKGDGAREIASLYADAQFSIHLPLPADAPRTRRPAAGTEVSPAPPPPPPLQPTRIPPRRSSRAPAPVEEEVVEENIEAEVMEVPPTPPAKANAASKGKRTAVRESEQRRAVASAEKSKSRKPRPTAPPAPVLDEDEQHRQQEFLLAHPFIPLKLKQAATVYRLHYPPCSPFTSPASAPLVRCKADHPNCLHQLGYKRRGVWATRPPHLALLGSNPQDNMRQDNVFSGLKNLGATCYVNILLQTLFMNPHFRDSLWHFESSDADVRRRWEGAVKEGGPEPVSGAGGGGGGGDVANLPYHLLTVFTQLSLSRRSFVDPLELINRLGISHTEQQDAHEFRTYLMQALEDSLAQSTFTPHHSLLRTLFEGQSRSVLRCTHCQHQSCTEVPFVDLGVSIKGKGSVYAGFQSLVEDEFLDEANAVYCSQCRTKRPMAKHVEYVQLPPYLNVQLMRFELVFQGNAVRKKKIGEKIYIPEKINVKRSLAHYTLHTVPVDPSALSAGTAQPSVNETKEHSGSLQAEMKEGREGRTSEKLEGVKAESSAPSPVSLLPRLEESLPLLPPPPPLAELEMEAAALDEEMKAADSGLAEEKEESTAAPVAPAPSKKRRKTASVVSHPKKSGASRSRAKQKKEAEMMEVDDFKDGSHLLEVIDVEPIILSTPPPANKSRKKSHSKKKAAADDAIDLTASASSAAKRPPPPSCYNAADDADDYHLMAVLLHKGQYANHGHYTATLRDDRGCWWSFDDRIVKRLGENFYHKGGEVVLDAAETKDEAKADQKEAPLDEPRTEATAAGGPVMEERKDEELKEVSSTAELVQDTQAAEMEVEATTGRPKRRPSKKSAEEQPLLSDAQDASIVTPKSKKKGAAGKGKAKGKASGEAAKGEGASKAGKKASSAKSKKPRSDDGVDPRTKAEAERMYGPGGYSKDAYMLLYANLRHPRLQELEAQQSKEADLHRRVDSHEPTFLTVQSHIPLAAAFLARHRHLQVERDNADFEQQKAAYQEKRRQVMEVVDRRKAEVEALAPHLQAEAIDLQQIHNDVELNPDSCEAVEGDHPTRFINSDWLSAFLTGWPVEEKPQKVKTAEKVKVKEQEKDTTLSPKEEVVEDKAEGVLNEPIDVSSDSDDGSGDATRASSPATAEAAAKVEVVIDDEAKSADDDQSHLVVDHDVHISLAGMDEALRTVSRHLDPGPLSDAVDRIRCPKHPSKVSPHALPQVKRITKGGWDRLTRLLGNRLPDPARPTDSGAPEAAATAQSEEVDGVPSSELEELSPFPSLALSDLCLVCARELFLGDEQRRRDVEHDKQLLSDYEEYRAAHKSHNRIGKAPIDLPPDALWIDKHWIQRWKKHVHDASRASKTAALHSSFQSNLKQQREGGVGLGDLTAGIQCEHGELDVEPTRRTFVSRDLWHRLVKAGCLDSKLLSVREEECQQCTQAGQDEDAEQKKYAAAMKDEKNAMRHWSTRDFAFPHPEYPPIAGKSGNKFYLVPSAFHAEVAAYYRSNDSAAVRPRFDACPLLCKHSLLQYQPRPEWDVVEDGIRGTRPGLMVWAEEGVWQTLKRFGYVDADEAGVQLRLEKLPLPALQMQAARQWEILATITVPTVCTACCLERQHAEEAERLRFTREDGGGITVVTVATEEEAKNPAQLTSSNLSTTTAPTASSGLSPSMTGASARPRRTAGRRNAGASVHQVLCSSSDTVMSLKMELMQLMAADCPPNRQQLWYKGQKMENAKSLDDYRVVRGAEVRLLVADDGDDEFDLAASEGEPKKGKAASERGFQGTALGWHARQLVQSGQQSGGVTAQEEAAAAAASPTSAKAPPLESVAEVVEPKGEPASIVS